MVHAKAGSLFGAVLKITGLLLFVVPGMISRILYPSKKKTSYILSTIDQHKHMIYSPGADSGFQVRGGGSSLKKIAPCGGRRENFEVFRVKNHDFTQTNHIFSNFREAPPPGSAPDVRREKVLGISCEKSRFYAKESFFSNFRGARAGCPPTPLDPPL
jgi:hypothetical protein